MYTKINTEIGGMALREAPVRISARRCADGNGSLTYLFFSDEFVDVQRAKAICAKCTSYAECLNGAIEREEPWGVWGGELIEYGRVVKDKKPRGRPSTKVRPTIAIEEVPIPAHLVA